ncbi:MAG: GNAT family N-acetyltransferase [Nitrospira sp.]|nr:GNAT family N-acetyltransferase [Nitrospira sp.]
MIVVPLSDRHDRSQFDCGEASLNFYLQRYAGQHDRRGFGRTYVAISESSSTIRGYYTISSGSIAFETVPENLPHHPVPIVLLGRLAVDQQSQGQGVGGLLLVDALRRAQRAADELGIYAVAVEALSDRARSFYERFGFRALTDDRLHLYLAIKVVRRLRL